MKSDFVQQITLYKYRYYIGFGLLAILGLLLAGYRFWLLPNGLSAEEMSVAATAGHLSPLGLVKDYGDSLAQLVNLPWVLTEWLSIKVFGFSTFAMRLPAVILMLLAATALIATIWKWSRANIAAISGLVILTSVMFMGMARSGTAAAMTTFLISLLVLSPTLLLSIKKTSRWTTVLKVLLCLAAAALVYSPGGLYIVVLLFLAGVLHPKTRFLVLRLKPWKLIVAIVIGLVVLSPLLTGIILQMIDGEFGLLQSLLALNINWSWQNLSVFASAFVSVNSSWANSLLLPIVTIVELVVMILGLIKILTEVASARAYLLLALLLLALVLAAGEPSFIYLLFVPLALLLSIGFATLIRSWYKLFPRNPYARILATVLLAALIGGVALTNVMRYRDAQNYSAAVVYNYDQEFETLRGYLREHEDFSGSLIVEPEQERFYQLLTRKFDKLEIKTNVEENEKNLIILDSAGIVPEIVLKQNSEQTESEGGESAEEIVSREKMLPQKILTNGLSRDSVLVRMY
ncbi:glycosyltransferase family 39 protein [Candidatus Saccharibacteria bacterium]|nr:glycosyltransferase family 39 protein [Candidatus Saccharibacteria bacterium]